MRRCGGVGHDEALVEGPVCFVKLYASFWGAFGGGRLEPRLYEQKKIGG
ncbi:MULTISPECIES: hypothetical protein [unclassified Bartonella]|nr:MULTISPECIES: hypothetical protein [unclassified Bartonella]